MDRKKKGLVLSIFGILSLILITAGVTYAFFNYVKEGTTENMITTGTITFIYEEVEQQGAGISIADAFPISDENGKLQSGAGNVFNFKVESQVTGDTSIPYTVTARMKNGSTLDQSAVKLYLTEVSGSTETELELDLYSNLANYANAPDGIVEKVIYTDTVPIASTDYEKNFRLRMWISDTIDFSQNADGTYSYNGKTFTVTVNVYANAEVVNSPVTPTTMTATTTLSVGDSVTATDGSKWHVLEESASGVETVVLLSDYNLNSTGSYNTTCGRDISGSGVCNGMKFDADGTSTYDENDTNNVGYFIKNIYSPLVTSSLVGTSNVTLPTADQIAVVDGIDYTSESIYLSSLWLTTTAYWTRTAKSTSGVYYVDSSFNALGASNVANTNTVGVRPVITTPKTNLLAG